MKFSFLRLMPLISLLSFVAGVDNAGASIQISQQPLFTIAGQPPLMMMVMSRDEQVFNKAYPDYTDLDGDGVIDTSYQNKFDYSGYFDSNICYQYSNGQFSASAKASGANDHQCSGSWSGNFLNWVTMSRLDVLRFVFYGGMRSTDSATKTVLERAQIPNDLHAWAKVYAGSDIGLYTPLSSTTTFCNATFSSGGAPIMRAASGAYSEWAATALSQCNWREDVYASGNGGCNNADADSSCYDDASKKQAVNAGSSSGDFTVRVQVCGNTNALESFCATYGPTASPIYKPTGLLQKYGQDGSMRFGLLTGSFSRPRSGGVLRKNVGLFAGNAGTQDVNGCAQGDEVSLKNGIFCSKSSADEGIIKSMNALKLTKWSGSNWSDCQTYGILNRSPTSASGVSANGTLNDPGSGSYNCNAWGNPLSEMYAEALRYIAGGYGAAEKGTAAFIGGGDKTDVDLGLPNPIWKDPYRSTSKGGSPYCANCSILALSTGLNSFDSDEIPNVNGLRNVAVSTDNVGAMEGIQGNHLVGRISTGTPGNLAVGQSVDTYADLCTAKGVTDFSKVRGLCPDIPAMEGSYLIDGLAYDAWTTDLRPDLTSDPDNPKPAAYKNVVKTFGISLAESLPKFQIPVGGGKITLAPLCQANNTGSADARGGGNDKGWRSCFLGSVSVGQKVSLVDSHYVYGRSLEPNNSAGSFSLVWEDSLWGNDHDNDVVSVLTYCVGSACSKSSGLPTTTAQSYAGYDICWRTKGSGNDGSPVCGSNGKPAVGSDEVLIRIENVSAFAGNAMLTGYAVTGSDNDGPQRLALRPGNENGSLITKSKEPPSSWYAPMVKKFKIGAATVGQLENPLFYAAKYGSFKDGNGNGKPDAGEWDTEHSGQPDNYFAVTNPARLKAELEKIFSQVIADARPTASVATSTPRFVSGNTLAYEASYDAKDWSGDLKAYNIRANGVYNDAPPVWQASHKLPAADARAIFTSKTASPTATAFGGLGISFDKTTLAGEALIQAQLMTGLDTTIYNSGDVIDYLRGNQSKEADQTPPGPYRMRSTPIGDILNSSPAVVGVTSFGYGQILAAAAPTQAASYADFVSAKKGYFGNNSESPVIFVGANDGMLHAFDGSTSGGKELFGYIPNGVLSSVGALATPGYAHKYYVDGTPTVSDAYIGGWKSVLVSSVGAGGRSVFALDITNPRSFTKDNVLWEFNSDSPGADASKMGQSIGRPWVGYADDGNWVAAFGNGYNSGDGKAYLFVRKLGDGSKVATVAVGSACGEPAEAGCDAASNGLSSAVLVDNDGNGAGDTIYAGDYLGNLWRFELDTTSSAWVLGNGGRPLFIAKDSGGKRQSITSGVYTASNPLGGTIVVFGTGRYLNTSDADPSQIGVAGRASVDSVYGVWDSRTCADVQSTMNPDGSLANVRCRTWSSTSQTIVRADLMSQEIKSYTPLNTANGTGGELTATKNGVDYGSGVGQSMGWYLDLSFKVGAGANAADPLSGTRVVARPDGILTDVIINAMRPEGTTCEPGVLNTTLVLDALTGAADYVPVDGVGASQKNLVGIDTYRGPPQGEPSILLNQQGANIFNGVLPPMPSDPTGPGAGVTVGQCSWVSPNPSGRPPGKPMPCGRISWKQLQ